MQTLFLISVLWLYFQYKMVKRLKNKSKTVNTRRKKKHKQNNAFRYITGGDSELYTAGASLSTAAVWSTSETPLLSTVITPLSTPDKPTTTTTTAASTVYSAERISVSGTDPNSKIGKFCDFVNSHKT